VGILINVKLLYKYNQFILTYLFSYNHI
jgi:hypothetical protein